MKKLATIILCLFVLLNVNAQTGQIPDSLLSKVVMTVDTAKVTVEEFMWFNNKYNSYADEKLRLPLDEYSELFAEYKMKVIEAERKQLDTSYQFVKEFQSYIKPTAKKFLYDDKIEDDFVDVTYGRMQSDIEVKHIFVKCDRYSDPKDTLAAYRKAQAIKSDLLRGKDFGTYAKQVSDDIFTKDDGGYIGWVTALLQPLSYENAIYNAQIGEIVGPVSTRYGYYVIQVLNKRKTKGLRKPSLLIIYANDTIENSWVNAKLTADTIYSELEKGVSFDSLFYKYNTNARLMYSKGDIGWLDNSMKYPPDFKEAILAVDSAKHYTKIIKQHYGYVIAYIKDSKPEFSKEEGDKLIRKYLQKDESRKGLKERAFVANQLKLHNVKIYSQNLEEFIDLVDNSILMNKWQAATFSPNKVLLHFPDKDYYYSDFALFLQMNQKQKGIGEKDILIRFVAEKYVNRMLEFYAFKNLTNSNKEFRMIVQEYHDGMIMYELLQKEVYSKAAKDSLGLEAFYRSNSKKYMRNEGVNISYFYCKNDKIKTKVSSILEKRNKKFLSDKEILGQVNKKEMDNVILDSITVYKGENSAIDSLTWEVGTIYYFDNNKIAYINEVYEQAPKPLSECKSKVIADYQFWLEDRWKERLHKKYTYSLNKDIFIELQKYVN